MVKISALSRTESFLERNVIHFDLRGSLVEDGRQLFIPATRMTPATESVRIVLISFACDPEAARVVGKLHTLLLPLSRGDDLLVATPATALSRVRQRVEVPKVEAPLQCASCTTRVGIAIHVWDSGRLLWNQVDPLGNPVLNAAQVAHVVAGYAEISIRQPGTPLAVTERWRRRLHRTALHLPFRANVATPCASASGPVRASGS
jgi:hypothetical protein